MDLSPDQLAFHAGLLGPDEHQRAERFRFDVHRNRFIARRGQLRQILAAAIGCAPDAIRYQIGEQGKPALTGPLADSRVTFNLSDSQDLALVAVGRDRELGVDVEWIRSNVMDDRIPERFFSPGEVAALRALPEAQQHRAFFDCWTRKEAFLKAKGGGLHLPLDSFDVSLSPDAPAVLLATRPDPSEVERWSLCALPVPDGFAGALVSYGPPPSTRIADWSP